MAATSLLVAEIDRNELAEWCEAKATRRRWTLAFLATIAALIGTVGYLGASNWLRFSDLAVVHAAERNQFDLLVDSAAKLNSKLAALETQSAEFLSRVNELQVPPSASIQEPAPTRRPVTGNRYILSSANPGLTYFSSLGAASLEPATRGFVNASRPFMIAMPRPKPSFLSMGSSGFDQVSTFDCWPRETCRPSGFEYIEDWTLSGTASDSGSFVVSFQLDFLPPKNLTDDFKGVSWEAAPQN